MQKLLHCSLAIGLALLFAVHVQAADKPGKAGKKAAKRQNNSVDKVFQLPPTITLSAEQSAKIEQLKEEFRPKIAEADRAVDGVMSPDRKKAVAAAMKEAKAAGTPAKEARKTAMAAANLSQEEQDRLKAAQQQRRQVQQTVRKRMREILTPEQLAQLPEPKRKAAGKGKKKAKPGVS